MIEQDVISVILPTYNRAKLLPKALESVLTQSYKNLQIIIADDASSDDTETVIKPYLSDKRIIYFKNKVNLGCHPNIRKALYEFANGKYIFGISDDTYLVDRDFLSKAVEMMNRHASKILFSNYVIAFEENGQHQLFKEYQNLPEVNTGEKMYFGWQNPIFLNSSTVVFEREHAVNFLNPYDKNIVFADQELWFRFFLSKDCRISFLNCHSIAFLSHFKSMTMNQKVSEFIDGLVWCTSTEVLAKQQFGENRVTKHVNFLLENSLMNAVGPIIKLNNIFRFMSLLKVSNPRAYQLFLPALLKNPGRLLRLLISICPSLYLACIKMRFQWRVFREAFTS